MDPDPDPRIHASANGSASDPDPDADPDRAFFVIDLEEANKKQVFLLITFRSYIYNIFQR